MQNFKTCLYTTVKNEKRLIEFINYYKKLGINYFIILDDNSKYPVNKMLLDNNIDKNIFTVLMTGNRSFWNIYCTAQHFDNEVFPVLKEKNIDYILYVDADEFLFLNKFDNMNDLINHYSPFDSLKINWLLFGSSKLKENTSDSIINTFNLSSEFLSSYIKSLTKVSSIDTTTIKSKNPHAFNIKKNGISKNILNEILNIEETNAITCKNLNIHYKKAPVYIAHYLLQDVYTYIDRKVLGFIFNRNSYHLSNEQIELVNKNKNIISDFILETNQEITMIYLDKLVDLLKMDKKQIDHYYSRFNYFDKNINNIINNDIKNYYNV